MNKKIVNSNCPEFGYELLSSVPYAYNLYLKGELEETISGFDTSGLYFFSPKHTETNCERSWNNMGKLWDTKFPNIVIHRPQLDWDLFSPPPFKEFYKDKSISFEKETIVIFNRYNNEWGGPPINYLDLTTLNTLFDMLSDEYQVVYVNLTKGDKYFDGAKPLELNDDEVLKKHPKVYSLYDVMDMYPDLSINEIQLRLFANCSKYISSNGGQLILSAYFGGENIIFSKKCRELDPNVNSFYKWYHKLGDGVFQHVDTYESLIQLVKEKWVLKKPLINILIRTSGRPNYFKGCVNSIYNQKYKNWNIIIGVDDPNTLKYTQQAKGRDITYNYDDIDIPKPPNSTDYGVSFRYNMYLNDLQNEVKDGYIIYLDDDDKLHDSNSLYNLVNVIKSDDDFVIWRVKFPNRLVPSDTNFGNPPVLKDISGIGFSFHVKNKEQWEPYKRGDYRVAKKLYNNIPNTVYLNEVITQLQRETEDGMGRKDDIIIANKKLSIIIPTFGYPNFLDECLKSVINSIKTLDCEILVGVDNCMVTQQYIKNNVFDKRITFYFFNKNVGPYIIKNSLSKIAYSDFLIFFDSDDIMIETFIQDIIIHKNNYELIKPMYLDFKDDIKNLNRYVSRTNTYGEGVFGVNKKFFLQMNGFEGWRCAADSDLMSRLYKNNIKLIHTETFGFYRRVHNNSLTQHPDTSLTSQMRNEYSKISKRKKTYGPLEQLTIHPFTQINYLKNNNDTTILSQTIDIPKTSKEKMMESLSKTKPFNLQKKDNKPDYDVINNLLNKKDVYRPSKNVKPVKENIPVNRNDLFEIKKGTLAEQNRDFFPQKRQRDDSRNPFSKKNNL